LALGLALINMHVSDFLANMDSGNDDEGWPWSEGSPDCFLFFELK